MVQNGCASPMDVNHSQACGVSCHGAAAVLGPHADAQTSAQFFIYQYKVALCPKRYSHDWGACPYAHEKEKARRRDPQAFEYSSCICPNAPKGDCPQSLQCPYAHTLFEYWLHPARFRTQMCRSGTDCRRALCFFAHTAEELRSPGQSSQCNELPPEAAAAPGVPPDVQQQQPLPEQQQQQQQPGFFGGALPRAAAPQDVPWNGLAEDRSGSSFASACSVVTAGGSSCRPMLPNPASTSATDVLYVPMEARLGSSSSPLLLPSGNGMLVPLQQQQQQQLLQQHPSQAYLLQQQPSQAYMLQLQLQLQQQQLQQQARLQAVQLQLRQQEQHARAAVRGMEQQQGVAVPMGLARAAGAAGSNSLEGCPLFAFNSASGCSGAMSAAAQPGIRSASNSCDILPVEYGCLEAGLTNSMANMSMGGGTYFASEPLVSVVANSSSNALGMPEAMLAVAGRQQQQQQRGSCGLVESWL